MSINTLELDTLTNAFAVCRMLLSDMQPRLEGLQHVYDSAGGVKESLTQADLDSQAAFSGLKKEQVDDALYVLTAVLLPGVKNGYAALAAMAARYRGMGAPPPMSTF